MRAYQYILTNSVSGSITLQYAPVEWNSDQCFWERSMTYFGIFRTFSTSELTFIKNGGAFLKEIFDREGTEAVCTFQVEALNILTYNYDIIYSGLIDFSTYKYTIGSSGTNVKAQIIDNDFINTIKTRESQAVDLSKLIGIDGLAISPFIHEGTQVKIPGRLDVYNASLFGSTDAIGAFPFSILSKEDDSISAVANGVTDQTSSSAAFFKPTFPTGLTVYLKLTGTVKMIHSGEGVQLYFKIYDSDSTLKTSVLIQTQNTITDNQTLTFNINTTYNLFALVSGDYVVLDMYYSETPSGIGWDGAGTTVTYPKQTYNDSVFIGYPYDEAFTRILQAISGVDSPFYSELLGRIDSELQNYPIDGELSLGVVTNGLLLRGFYPSELLDPNNQTDTDVSLNVCLKDLFTSLSAIKPLSLGIEQITITPSVEANALYNWYAATYNTSGASIAPIGWHVPTVDDWTALMLYYDATFTPTINNNIDLVGGYLKEIGLTHWDTPNLGADNSSGLTTIGGGFRSYDGTFGGLKLRSRFMSITGAWPDTGGSLECFNDTAHAYFESFAGDLFNNGYSIRLIKDSTILTNGQTGTITDIDGNVYPTICIGTQEWMTSNLKVTHYNNGTLIPVVMDNTTWETLTTGAMCYYDNIAPVPGVSEQKVRIEDITHAFQKNIFLIIEDATEITEEVASDLTFSALQMGFQKGEEQYNKPKGRYEYNMSVNYATPLTRQVNTLTEVSPYRADTNGIIGCLIKPKSYVTSESTPYDSDNFLINFVRSTVLQIARAENYSLIGGVDNQYNSYNLDYQPARNLRRWGSFLRGSLNKYLSKILSFIASDKNSQAYSQRTDETEIIYEGVDVPISDLDNPFFQNSYYEFQFKITDSIMTAMAGSTNGTPNYYGLVKFRNNTNEDYRYGWMMKLESRKPDEKGFGNMKLLKAAQPFELIIESYTNCSAGGASDGTVTLLASDGIAPYTYKIDDGSFQTDAIFTNIAAGMHVFTAEDSDGNIDMVSQIITEPVVNFANINLTTLWSGPTSPGINGYNNAIHLLRESSPGNNDFSIIVDSWYPNGSPGTGIKNKIWSMVSGINYKLSVVDIVCIEDNIGVARTQRWGGVISGTNDISDSFLNIGVIITVEFQV